MADGQPEQSVRARVEQDSMLFDSAVVAHGFAPFLRDYDVVVEVPAAKPDGSGSYISGRYRYRFSHCPEAIATSAVAPNSWAWDDAFTDMSAWEAAGAPGGFVWGVRYADAYPGMSYAEASDRARHWSQVLGHTMHEVLIETNVWLLRLVFHDFHVAQLAVGDPVTGELTDVVQ
jgi:hypothetical protein